jgi:hypothetical protein
VPFLANISAITLDVNLDDDPQDEFDHMYGAMKKMLEKLDDYYPERTITITSANPPYITPAVKSIL